MDNRLKIEHVKINILKPAEYNPREATEKDVKDLTESIKRFGIVDPFIVNSAPGRENIIIGGHFRWKVAKDMGIQEVPIVYVNIPDINKEQELNLRLNRNLGRWDLDLLANFDENLLKDVGFLSEELDDIFQLDMELAENFDLAEELKKLQIEKIEVKKGDIYQLGNHRLMCGDSTKEEDILKLMNGEKADFCFTDPPYILAYAQKRYKGISGRTTKGFGYKANRQYLETDEIPPDFTEKWMANVNKVQKENFHIIVFENWKNIKIIWNEMEKYWKVKNMIVWHLPNRCQGFAGKYRFFSKHDIAMVGSTVDELEFNMEDEGELQNDYEIALYAIKGKPHWEGYGKGKKICPTDFIEFPAANEKSSGQGIIFGTKPLEILIPYIKVLTKRDDIIIEPFCGSGSTLIAAEKMHRRCFATELVPTYVEVIKRRFEKFTGIKPVKIESGDMSGYEGKGAPKSNQEQPGQEI